MNNEQVGDGLGPDGLSEHQISADGACKTRRAWPFFAGSLCLYAALVARPVHVWISTADGRGCTDPHALWALALLLSGALGSVPLFRHVGQAAWISHPVRLLAPSLAGPRLNSLMHIGAALFIALSMVLGFVWLVPGVDRLTDRVRTLTVELDFMLYGMGILVGGAWAILLGRFQALGIPLTVALGLMWLTVSFAPRSWC